MSTDYLDSINARLDRIERLLLDKKNVLTFNEAVEFTGYSKSYLYKLTALNEIPYYKPSGKMVYFSRDELQDWLLSNKSKSNEELDQEATNFLNNKRK